MFFRRSGFSRFVSLFVVVEVLWRFRFFIVSGLFFVVLRSFFRLGVRGVIMFGVLLTRAVYIVYFGSGFIMVSFLLFDVVFRF